MEHKYRPRTYSKVEIIKWTQKSGLCGYKSWDPWTWKEKYYTLTFILKFNLFSLRLCKFQEAFVFNVLIKKHT